MCEDALKLIRHFLVTAERFGSSFIHKPFELSCCKKKKKNPFQSEKPVEELELLACLCKARFGVLSGINQNHLKHIKEQSLRHRAAVT